MSEPPFVRDPSWPPPRPPGTHVQAGDMHPGECGQWVDGPERGKHRVVVGSPMVAGHALDMLLLNVAKVHGLVGVWYTANAGTLYEKDRLVILEPWPGTGTPPLAVYPPAPSPVGWNGKCVRCGANTYLGAFKLEHEGPCGPGGKP